MAVKLRQRLSAVDQDSEVRDKKEVTLSPCWPSELSPTFCCSWLPMLKGRGGVCKVKVQGDREEYAWENK